MEAISSIHSRQPASTSVASRRPRPEEPVDRYLHEPARESAVYTPSLRPHLNAPLIARLPAPPDAVLQPRLDEDEARDVKRLQDRDRYVRIHEGRHAAALGAYAGAIHYNYEAGPDGRLYAVGGYTEVNTMPAPTPEAEAAKARMIRNAALAPGAVSGADFTVAVEAGNRERALRASSLA